MISKAGADVVRTITSQYKKKAYLRALFAFNRLLQSHAGRLSKMIYRTLMIIGSDVTVGVPREHSMFGGVR